MMLNKEIFTTDTHGNRIYRNNIWGVFMKTSKTSLYFKLTQFAGIFTLIVLIPLTKINYIIEICIIVGFVNIIMLLLDIRSLLLFPRKSRQELINTEKDNEIVNEILCRLDRIEEIITKTPTPKSMN